ncbi:MAG TPA: ATP-dependent helicase, partial [Chloroflexota bacterium]
SGSVIVVGDEDQAIYAWRHADARGVARFLQAFPAASLVSLERSYRHSKHIARAATALIQHNTQRAPRRIRTERAAGPRPVCYGAADERDEAEWVAGEISRLASEEGVAWQDIAVLYRVNAQSRAIEDILLRRSIPYRILSGRSFYAQPEVQRASVYLRLATDSTDDEAMRRLLSGVMGMGSTRLTLLQTSAERRGLSLYAFLDSGDQMPSLPAAVRARLASLADRAQRVVARRRESLIDVVGEAISAVGEELAAEGRDSDTALDDLDELLSLARRYHAGRGTLREFVDALALDTGTDSSPAGVNLISLHAAKGLEFSTVFLVGLEEGLLPHRRSLERREDVDEERRLCYVGMTRARDRLYLSYAQMRMLAGSGVTGQPSRFIGEIGPQNMVLKISRTAQLKPRLPEVGPGDRVMHPRWGAGTVERVEGQGRDTLTTIHFDRAGRQRLQLCHAPLSLLTQGSSHVAAG